MFSKWNLFSGVWAETLQYGLVNCNEVKRPGISYEAGLSVSDANMLRLDGTFSCGKKSDIFIFSFRFRRHLLPGEKFMASKGYPDDLCSLHQVIDEIFSFGYVRARHEATEKLLKNFKVLGVQFQLRLSLHAEYFFAVLSQKQLSIEHEGG